MKKMFNVIYNMKNKTLSFLIVNYNYKNYLNNFLKSKEKNDINPFRSNICQRLR